MLGDYALIAWCFLAFIGLILAWPKCGSLIATATIAVIWGFAMVAMNIVIAVLHALRMQRESCSPPRNPGHRRCP
jgi:hypothetical protein